MSAVIGGYNALEKQGLLLFIIMTSVIDGAFFLFLLKTSNQSIIAIIL